MGVRIREKTGCSRYNAFSTSLLIWMLAVGCQAPVLSTGQAIYVARCASCHGVNGEGDGPVARKLPDMPTRFANPMWRRSVDRSYVRRVITFGGSHVGISPLMPSGADIASDEQLMNALIEFVLELGN